MPRTEFDRVSFVCPYCTMQCGWNDKRKVWDGTQVPNKENPSCLQYAHPRCVPTAEQIVSARVSRASA